jgi:hypothetical protein
MCDPGDRKIIIYFKTVARFQRVRYSNSSHFCNKGYQGGRIFQHEDGAIPVLLPFIPKAQQITTGQTVTLSPDAPVLKKSTPGIGGDRSDCVSNTQLGPSAPTHQTHRFQIAMNAAS